MNRTLFEVSVIFCRENYKEEKNYNGNSVGKVTHWDFQVNCLSYVKTSFKSGARNTSISPANSSDSEDQSLSESAARSLMSKSSTQDSKAITPPKDSAQTPQSYEFHKHGDSEHLYPKEQHSSSQRSRTYKWSFQMCTFFMQFNVISLKNLIKYLLSLVNSVIRLLVFITLKYLALFVFLT